MHRRSGTPLAPSPPIPAHTQRTAPTSEWLHLQPLACPPPLRIALDAKGVSFSTGPGPLLPPSLLPLSRLDPHHDPTPPQAAPVSQMASHRSPLCSRGSEFGRVGMHRRAAWADYCQRPPPPRHKRARRGGFSILLHHDSPRPRSKRESAGVLVLLCRQPHHLTTTPPLAQTRDGGVL